jgi:hypothetical protein
METIVPIMLIILSSIYENPTYNFTCIYIPFAICIIDLLCKNSMHEYCKKICDKF